MLLLFSFIFKFDNVFIISSIFVFVILILNMVKLNFDVIPSNIDETYEQNLSPQQIVENLSLRFYFQISN